MRYFFVLTLLVFILVNCGEESAPPPEILTEVEPTGARPMPDPGIEGYAFPTDSGTINGWLAREDWPAIHRHAWGIWAGLTSVVNADCDGNMLRTFETWATPADIVAQLRGQSAPVSMSCGRPHLNQPTQLLHTGLLGTIADTVTFESVVYNPAAADYALSQRVFDRAALDAQLAAGKTTVRFPDDALTAKPVWRIIPAAATDGPYPIKTWNYPPENDIPYPEGEWQDSVFVDVSGTPTTTPNTFPLSDFIHFRLTENDVDYFASEFFDGSRKNFQIGDYAILVAMHVATREIRRWTWQTFWWSPHPAAPQLPSSGEIAALRPAQLTGAPAHYALSAAYSMVWPAQPEVGGRSAGTPVYAFNPYLEAPFDPSVFSYPSSVTDNGERIVNNVGIRTNCMSCHILANYDPKEENKFKMINYAADTYVSLDDPFFLGKLQTDFAWSVTFNIYRDSTDTSK